MKITKYPQSCLLVETRNKKILVDPGILKYKEEYFNIWNSTDVILVTHKHPDHLNLDVIKKLNKEIEVYSTKEVQKEYPEINIEIIEEGQTIKLDEINIDVVRAIHGYQPMLKDGKEIFENVGYIIDDGSNRLYITSDTICFNNDYKADILCTPITGHGITMSAFEVALYAKEVGASLVLPVHMDNDFYPTNLEYMKEMFNKYDVEYELLENEEDVEIE